MTQRRREIQRAIEEGLTDEPGVDYMTLARVRLARWGGALRRCVLMFGPRGYPAISAFATERIDGDAIYFRLMGERAMQEACETDTMLAPVREHSPRRYAAVVIHYVDREPGGKALTREEQVRRWNVETGLGKTAYYVDLSRANEYLAMALERKAMGQIQVAITQS